MNDQEFNEFCSQVEPDSADHRERKISLTNGVITFHNRTSGTFTIKAKTINVVLERWFNKGEEIEKFIVNHPKYDKNSPPWQYNEKIYRAVFKDSGFFEGQEFEEAVSLAQSQTKPLMYAINKYIGFYTGNRKCAYDNDLLLDKVSLARFVEKIRDKTAPVTLPDFPTSHLKEAFVVICQFCAEYQSRNTPYLTGAPEVAAVSESLGFLKAWAEKHFGSYREITFDVKISKGAGWFPRVPWLCILPPNQEVNSGIYLAFCFGREGNGAVVGCAESVTNRKGLETKKRSKNVTLSIDVDGGSPSTHYNDAFENPLEVTPSTFDEKILIEHVRKSLDLCIGHLKLERPVTPEYKIEEMYSIMISSFEEAIRDRFLFRGIDIRRFIVSLLAKPFVILTGNSGTGKTKIAQIFSRWISRGNDLQYCVIPVGADWTDNRNVIGFLNHLKKGPDGEGNLFQSTPILDLILTARNDPNFPYFLILDEMNLSHVERYFSDFLSTMESGERIHLHQEEMEIYTSKGKKLDGEMILPQNLFVIGTVNVDETTYMFSPKVLDRANVIELRMDRDLFDKFLSLQKMNGSDFGQAPEGLAEAFLNLSCRARGLSYRGDVLPGLQNPMDTKETKNKVLEFFDLLKITGMEFGFRTVGEITRYINVDYELTAEKDKWSWKDCLDIQILQKILPKLHGSRRKLEAVLVSLTKLCEGEPFEKAKKSLEPNANLGTYNPDNKKLDATFPLSFLKLSEMIYSVRRDQFVSFIQ